MEPRAPSVTSMSDHGYQGDFSEDSTDDDFEFVKRPASAQSSASPTSERETEGENSSCWERDVSQAAEGDDIKINGVEDGRFAEDANHDLVSDGESDENDLSMETTLHIKSEAGTTTTLDILESSFFVPSRMQSEEEPAPGATQQSSTPQICLHDSNIVLSELPLTNRPDIALGSHALQLSSFTSLYGANKLTLHMLMSKELLRLNRTFRLLYCGLPRHRDRIVNKLTDALSLSAQAIDVQHVVDTFGCTAFIEIYTTRSSPNELCMISMKDEKATGSHRIDHPTIVFSDDEFQVTRCCMPDLAIVVQEEWSFTSVLFKADKIKQQNIPVIELWTNKPEDMWRNEPCDEDALHLLVQHGSARRADSVLDEDVKQVMHSPKKVGLDLATFEGIDPSQLNRHIVHLKNTANARSLSRAVRRQPLSQTIQQFVCKHSPALSDISSWSTGSIVVSLLVMMFASLYFFCVTRTGMGSAVMFPPVATLASGPSTPTLAVAPMSPATKEASTETIRATSLTKSVPDITTGYGLGASAVANWCGVRDQKEKAPRGKQEKHDKPCHRCKDGQSASWTLQANEDGFILTTISKTSWRQKPAQPRIVIVGTDGTSRAVSLIPIDSRTYGLDLKPAELDADELLVVGDRLKDAYLLQRHSVRRLGLSKEMLQGSDHLENRAIAIMKQLQDEKRSKAATLANFYNEFQGALSGVKSRAQQILDEAAVSAEVTSKHIQSLIRAKDWSSPFDKWQPGYYSSDRGVKPVAKALRARESNFRKHMAGAAEIIHEHSRSAAETMKHEAISAVKKASGRAKEVTDQLHGVKHHFQRAAEGVFEGAAGVRMWMRRAV